MDCCLGYLVSNGSVLLNLATKIVCQMLSSVRMRRGKLVKRVTTVTIRAMPNIYKVQKRCCHQHDENNIHKTHT